MLFSSHHAYTNKYFVNISCRVCVKYSANQFRNVGLSFCFCLDAICSDIITSRMNQNFIQINSVTPDIDMIPSEDNVILFLTRQKLSLINCVLHCDINTTAECARSCHVALTSYINGSTKAHPHNRCHHNNRQICK